MVACATSALWSNWLGISAPTRLRNTCCLCGPSENLTEKSVRPPIQITTFLDGTAAYAVDEDGEPIAAYDADCPRKSLRLLLQMLHQLDSETYFNPRFEIRHEEL